MSDKERKKKKLVRTLICVSAAVVVVLVIATLVIGQLPLPSYRIAHRCCGAQGPVGYTYLQPAAVGCR